MSGAASIAITGGVTDGRDDHRTLNPPGAIGLATQANNGQAFLTLAVLQFHPLDSTGAIQIGV